MIRPWLKLAVAAVVAAGVFSAATPATAGAQAQTRYIVYVAYFDNASHSNLVGAATFSDCPGDPSYSWGSQTSYYTIDSEPCG